MQNIRHRREGGYNPIGIHRPFAPYHAVPAQSRDPYRRWRGPSRRGAVAENAQIQVFVAAWISAFAETAREAHSEIMTMLVDVNCITASKTGAQGNRRSPGPWIPLSRE